MDETKNYLLNEIKHNDLMSKRYKKTCKYLNYVGNLILLASKITGFVSISGFASLIAIPVGITSSAVGIRIFAITAGIKWMKLTVFKKRKKHGKIVLLGKAKLDFIKVYKSLID